MMFQTSGDVTISHLMKSVMLLSGERPRTLTLALPAWAVPSIIPLLRRYMTLEWVAHLNLILNASNEAVDLYPLLEQIGVPMQRITVALVGDACSLGLLMFAGPSGTVAIQGPLCPAPSQGLHLYSAIYGPSGSPLMRSFTDPITAYIKARTVELAVPTAEGQPEEEENEQEPPAARSGRKKKSRTPKGQRLESDTKTLT